MIFVIMNYALHLVGNAQIGPTIIATHVNIHFLHDGNCKNDQLMYHT